MAPDFLQMSQRLACATRYTLELLRNYVSEYTRIQILVIFPTEGLALDCSVSCFKCTGYMEITSMPLKQLLKKMGKTNVD